MDMLASGFAYFNKGGMVMYFLLFCSVFSVVIAIDRTMFFKANDAGRAFTQVFYDRLAAHDYDGAYQRTAGNYATLPIVLREAMARAAHGEPNLGNFMEVQIGIAMSRFKQRLYYLSIIASMAPLLGLLGTILGMISALSVFSAGAGQVGVVTSGVGEALISTAFGLCVAILAIAIHSYFTQRSDNVLADMEQCCSMLEHERDRIHAARLAV